MSCKCPLSGNKPISLKGLRGSPQYLSVLFSVTGKYRYIDDLISLFYSFLEIFSKKIINIFVSNSLEDCFNKKINKRFSELGIMSSKKELIFLGKYIDKLILDFNLNLPIADQLNPKINFKYLIKNILDIK